MAKSCPESFKSFEEYEAYCHCLFKMKVGDEADAYFHEILTNRYEPSNTPTDITHRVVCLGRRKPNYRDDKFNSIILLGSHMTNIRFWKIIETSSRHLQPGHIADKYEYGFWSYPEDVRIAKIYKP
jgi:hypothetical protein